MRDCSQLLYFDKQDHTWRFYITDSGELVYSIMYEEDKWTKDSKIDSEVIDFTVNINKELKVFMIYSIKGGQLRYCIWENSQWFGKTLYGFENQGYKISEINVNTIGNYMHIFFIAKNSIQKSQCSLMHFCWSDEENIFNTIYNISFMREAYSHYQTEVLKTGNLYLLLIHHEENEFAIKLTEYKDGRWSIPRRLYGINGSNINFCTMQHNNKISILNLSKEGSIYSLEHVLIEPDGRMKSNKIYEGSIELKNYLLLVNSGVLWAMWSEGEKVFASSYKGKWKEPVSCGGEINQGILTYKYLSLNNKHKNLNSKYILGTMPPEINLLLPEDKNNENINYSLINSEKDKVNSLKQKEEKNIESVDDIMVLKRSNKSLEKRIIDLQMKLQQKQRIIGESDENFIKLTNGKKKAEEKLKIITEVQQISIKELEEIKNQKIAMDNTLVELKSKAEELINENEQFKKVIEVVKNQKIAKDNMVDDLKNKLREIISENQQLKAELEVLKNQKIGKDNVIGELKNKLKELSSENEQLKIEIKYENNKGIVDRILKKKLDR
ncbi:MAG: hypothetical protein H7Y18_00525 [Clostridiaceae bacterium]|nr:hypothetical protein [Clostridiaceae bacterium]